MIKIHHLPLATKYLVLNSCVLSIALYQLIPLRTIGDISDLDIDRIQDDLLKRTLGVSKSIKFQKIKDYFQINNLSNLVNKLIKPDTALTNSQPVPDPHHSL